MPKQSMDCPKQHKAIYDQSHHFHHDSQESGHDSLTKVPTIDDFVFIKPISRGAFGKVFLGQKKGNLDKLYAIKAMKKSDMVNKNLVGQVVIERDAMAKLSSPFVVQLYYSIQTHHNIFLVMEYLIGGDLKSLLGVAGCFEEPMAIMYVAEVALALEYLHNKHIIHRDLKPDNMLLTDKGHIKLTDFGLSKFNMHFSAHDMPMTPKTPLPYSKVDLDYYRTPGQILSLRSSLAFSAETCASHKKLTPQSPLAEDSYMASEKGPLGAAHETTNTTPKLRNQKCMKQKTMRDVLLTNSASKKYMTQYIISTPGKQEVVSQIKSAPVASLRTTLEASLDRKSSTQSESTENTSSVNVSDLSSIAPMNRPIGLSLSCQDNIDNIYGVHSIMSSDGVGKNLNLGSIGEDISDSVFELVNMTDPELEFSADNSVFKVANIRACTCQNTLEHDWELCSECTSHSKAPSRQEKLTDNTPQMHRTEESVLNSYAAQNLRSLRHGWNSEGSEHDSSAKENVDHSCFDKKEEVHCDKSHPLKKRRLVKAKSFCYPSDEESQTFKNRYGQIRFARKRSFHHVELSPVRRAHSAESGLTQEFQLLQCDFPASKRSNTLPRTRIRFPSASETENRNDMVFNAIASEQSFVSSNNCKKDVYMDKMEFCASEQMFVQSRDNTSKFESEKTHVPYTAELSNQSECNNESSISGQQQNFVDKDKQESMSFEHHDTVYSVHNYDHNVSNTIRFPLNTCNPHLRKPITSCLRSEDAEHGGPRLSFSLDDDKENDDGDVMSYKSSTVTSSPESLEPMEVHRSISPAEKTTGFSLTHPKQPLPLFPPPPPKTRESSGKITPVKTRFNSVTSCIPPCMPDDIQNRSNVHMSDGQVLLPKSHLNAHSFAYTTKTPYRTPKSVRRARVHSEEERILGTPDYLAPEILQQKPHGPAVDWWSLGICMFEFLTGEPPFNDQTPELVFTNILNRDIPWPEGDEALSKECREAIERLLTMDPDKRPKARDVRKMDAFRNIDWHTVLEKEAPWLPQPDNDMDTNYFEVRNMIQGLFVSDVDF